MNVRFWPLTDIAYVAFDVAFGGKADMTWACTNVRPKQARSLPARSRDKAPDLRPAVIVLVEPYHGPPEFVWYSYQRIGRHLDPLAVKPHSIFSIFRIPIHILDGLAISN